jgi:hypothetical protein
MLVIALFLLVSPFYFFVVLELYGEGRFVSFGIFLTIPITIFVMFVRGLAKSHRIDKATHLNLDVADESQERKHVS